MLQRVAMASARALMGVQAPCRYSGLLGCTGVLRVPAHSRTLTGGEVREAARNAKASLLRAHAVEGQAPAAQTPLPDQASFLNLSVDDRVVVSPVTSLCSLYLLVVALKVPLEKCTRLHVCLLPSCRVAFRKAMYRSPPLSKRLPYPLSCRAGT